VLTTGFAITFLLNQKTGDISRNSPIFVVPQPGNNQTPHFIQASC
jgi:hypothetical protein